MIRRLSENGVVNKGFQSDEVNLSEEKLAKIQITRSVYDQQNLNNEMIYTETSKSAAKCGNINGKSFKSFFLKTFPILSWLYSYKREYLAPDIISGLSVVALQIPGMGHALLAYLPPVVGIYMGFYPVLVYGILGSSMHCSLGTFSVLAIMTEKSVVKFSNPYADTKIFGNSTEGVEALHDYGYSPLEVACLLCFLVGAIQLFMYVFRLGIVAFVLSDALVSGLITGAACHVFSAQVKDFFGVRIPPVGAYGKIIYTFIEIFKKFESFNYFTLAFFLTCSFLLIFNNEWLKTRVAKKTKIPVPMDLIIIVVSMLLSKFLDLEGKFNIFLVGEIPGGLPPPIIPKFGLWKELLPDAIAVAFVSYSVTVSMGQFLGQKCNYEVDFNQELLALGSSNVVGSFFSCFPLSAALARSMMQYQVGGRTQMASLVNVVVVMCILLWIAPLFEILPRCVLAAIIVTTLKNLLLQVRDFKKFLNKSKIDGMIWAVTFFTVILVAIDIGLFVGTALSVLGLLYVSLKPHVCILGNIPNTDLYLDIEKFAKSLEIPFVKIFHYGGSINFATKASFKNQLLKKTGVNLIKELKRAECQKKDPETVDPKLGFKHLVIDFSALSQIDSPSVTMLDGLIRDFRKLKVKVSIAGCSTKIYEALMSHHFSFMDVLHPTIHDAVIAFQ